MCKRKAIKDEAGESFYQENGFLAIGDPALEYIRQVEETMAQFGTDAGARGERDRSWRRGRRARGVADGLAAMVFYSFTVHVDIEQCSLGAHTHNDSIPV